MMCSLDLSYSRSVYNPRTRGRAALKKIPNAFHSLLSSIRTFREIKMLCELDHENVSVIILSHDMHYNN